MQLLKRLLEERRPRVELVLQDRPVPPAHGSGTLVSEGSGSLSGLGEKWGKLMQEAEARWVRAKTFLSGVGSPIPAYTGCLDSQQPAVVP